MTAAPPKPKQPPRLNAAGARGIFDGQTRVGTIVPQGDEFFAFDASGKCIGSFDSVLEASRKILRADRRDAAS
jgi:hypothetical protein